MSNQSALDDVLAQVRSRELDRDYNQLKEINAMREAIQKVAYDSYGFIGDPGKLEFSPIQGLARMVLQQGRYKGLSGEDIMTWLAFEALKQLETIHAKTLRDMRNSIWPRIMPEMREV